VIKRLFGLLLLGLLAACNSTRPPMAGNQATPQPAITPVPPTAQATPGVTGIPATSSTSTAAAKSGPITPIMTKLQLDGERYATLGDPAAPITVIEFSDFG